MSEKERNQFARLLKYYLMMNNKTQSDMVNDLGYDKSTVSGWCNGNRVPKVDVIIQIANYLHVNVGDLIIETNNVPNNVQKKYYIDDDTAATAQEIFEQDKILFDVYKGAKKDDLIKYAEYLKSLEEKEEGGN